MEIIEAEEQHIPAMQKIYAWHVLHGTASFETQPPDVREMASRLKKINEAGLLWLVVLHEGEVKGYCYLGRYRERYAYRHTLEDSIYIDPAFQKRGAGKALLRRAIDWAETHGYRQMIGNVGDSENKASINLHLAAGFQIKGTLHCVGFKHGRWLDTVFMQRALGEGNQTLPAQEG
ncbi:GNAT family N-acetyltransferase [Rahnella victoriana]|uniref:N-acetyltransferase n=1 Tax=Rahnella victoriana TaxID=1510570 RepID=A0ABS0DRY0_9GAMM|nr:GNAT family N-acetyltransferase [Rahnella victoriana]MBF7956627.1 N-acetyltransferase [Rahnella victoriana]